MDFKNKIKLKGWVGGGVGIVLPGHSWRTNSHLCLLVDLGVSERSTYLPSRDGAMVLIYIFLTLKTISFDSRFD